MQGLISNGQQEKKVAFPLNLSKAEGLFIAYSSRVADWLLPILGNKTTLNDIHY